MAKDDKRRTRHLDLDDVLAGRGKPPSARDLVELIRATNPTGLALKAKDTARRYAQKSRLQSLLIDQFSEDLEVTLDPHEPGVVGLRYRPLDMHACHVLLEALDDDARSWAQGELDRTAFEAARPPATPALAKRRDDAPRRAAVDVEKGPDQAVELSAAELIDLGQTAVDAYDYELARAHLTRALALASGGLEAALPLLALLVDHLAADDEALALEAQLSPAARRHHEARLLLGLAAARAGQRERAIALLDGHRSARSAEPFLVLARAAITVGDVEAASGDLVAARERDPIHPQLRDVESALAALRACERSPLEEALTALLDSGRIDEAEIRARALLARFPDSEVGRRVLRILDERRREAQVRQLVAEAEEAVARDELTLALALFGRALAAGPRGEHLAPLQVRIEAVNAALRGRAEQTEVEKTVALLGDRERLAGLLAYLALAEPLRGRIRARVDLPHFAWLAQMGSGERPRAAALAVIALERADALVAEAPQAALDRIEEHEVALRGVGRRAEIEREARSHLALRRREAAERRVHEARACFEEGAFERAEALLAPELLGDLPKPSRAIAEALRARVAHAHEGRLLIATFEKRRRDGALLPARDAVDALLARENEPERDRWRTIRAELGAAIRAAFRVRFDPTPRPVTSLRHLNLDSLNGVPRLLPQDGDVVPFVETWGRWVFVRVIDLASRIERARILLSTPAPLDVVGAQVDGDRVIVVGRLGAVLELDLTDGSILGWYESAHPASVEFGPESGLVHGGVDLQAHEEVIDDAVLVPGTRLLWRVLQNSRLRRRSVHIVDLARRRIVRELEESTGRIFLALVDQRREPLIAVVSYDDETVVFHEPRGAPLRNGKLTVGAIPWTILAVPGSEQIVMFTGGRKTRSADVEPPISWCIFTPGVGMSPERVVEGLRGRDSCAAMDQASGLIYFWSRISSDDSDPNELTALRIENANPGAPGATGGTAAQRPSIEQLYRVPISPRMVLIQGTLRPGATALVATEEDFEIAELGPEAPPLRPARKIGQIRIKNINNATSRCEDPAGTRGDAMKALAATLRHEPRSAWARRWSGLQQEGDVMKMLELALALRALREHGESSTVNRWLSIKFPDNPAVRLMQAGPLVNVRRWPDVIELLCSVNSRALDEGDEQHLHHLLGLAFLNLGESDEAQRLFKRGMAIHGGRCELGALLALATPFAESAAAPEPAWAAEELAVRELFAAIEAADRCLTRGDGASAIVALDRLVVTETGEVQSLARRAEAHLLDDGAAGQSLFEKACALAWFCAAHGEKKAHLRRELPIPRGRWDTARLDGLLKRATHWLDTMLGDAWPLPAGGL